jgi:hypothetical protein
MLRVVAVRSLTGVLVVAMAALGAVAGCGGRSPIEPGGGSSARGGGSAGQSGTAGEGSAGQSGCNNAPCTPPAGPCDMLLDEKSCAAHPECEELHCPDCKGGQAFVGCTEPDSGLMVGCGPCPTSPSCNTLDETTCNGRSDCEAAYCPDCMGGQIFWSCAVPGSGGGCPPSCPPPCGSLDEVSCKTRSDCAALSCPNCDGGQTFEGCAASGGAGIACGLDCPAPPCSGLDETTCKTRSDCHPGYCGNCSGAQTFAGCVGPNEAVACPAYSCPVVPTPCANVTDEPTCDAKPDCHSVFGKCTNCPCPTTGCPEIFSSCADGGKAACNKPTITSGVVCDRLPPSCQAPAFVVSYTTDCYEGCVPPSECGP